MRHRGGKSPATTGRAAAIAPLQGEGETAVSLERARFGARILERMIALGTARVLQRGRRGPIGAAAGQGQILQQSGTHAIEPRIEFALDLAQCCRGMGNPPCPHRCRHVLRQLLPQGVVDWTTHPCRPRYCESFPIVPSPEIVRRTRRWTQTNADTSSFVHVRPCSSAPVYPKLNRSTYTRGPAATRSSDTSSKRLKFSTKRVARSRALAS